jgi:hypothetical protein
METPPFAPHANTDKTPREGKASRRAFLRTSGAAIAAAFLPASVLSLANAGAVYARPAKQSLLPPIVDFGKNPYAEEAIGHLHSLLNQDQDKPFPGFSRSTSASQVATVCSDTLELIRAYLYEDSPLKADASCLKAIIARCDCIFSYAKHVRGNEDYLYLADMCEILLMLTELMPTKVDQARTTEWKEAVGAVMQPVFENNVEHLVVTQLAKAWTNVDVRIIAAIAYSGMVLGLPKYRTLALGSGIRLMEKVIQPDGGVNYSDEQNDCFAYHTVFVTTLARLWQVTGEKACYDLAAATQWYIPVSTGPYGTAEYYTAPSWKQLWDSSPAVEAAAVVVGMTGNAYNVDYLKRFRPPGSLFLASFYKSDVAPKAMPESYMFYDQNIRGPRGRNGNYAFAATGRPTPGSNRGKSTYVGCMVVNDPAKLPASAGDYSLDTALAGVGIEITTSQRVDYNQSTPEDLIYLVQRETVAVTAKEKVAAVSSHHRLSAYQHAPSDWFVTEAWLLTPERIVGLIDLHALSDQLACAIKGVLRFVSGVGTLGSAKAFEKIAPKTGDSEADKAVAYTYGALTARVIEHDFNDVSVSYVNTFNDTARKSGRLVLSSQSAGVRMYPLGTSHFFVVEIHPTRFAPARSIKRITNQNGTVGLEVNEENGLKYKLLVNDTSGVVDIKEAFNDVRADAQVFEANDFFRLPFLPPIAAKAAKPSGRLAEFSALANLLDLDGSNAGVKEADEPDNKNEIRPYKHKIIISGAI